MAGSQTRSEEDLLMFHCYECGKEITEKEKERDACSRCGCPYHDPMEDYEEDG